MGKKGDTILAGMRTSVVRICTQDNLLPLLLEREEKTSNLGWQVMTKLNFSDRARTGITKLISHFKHVPKDGTFVMEKKKKNISCHSILKHDIQVGTIFIYLYIFINS